MYFAGDGARRDEDGYFWIMGRVDDVMNVSGHRLGTARRSSRRSSDHDSVVEAAVVGMPHEIKGTGPSRPSAPSSRWHTPGDDHDAVEAAQGPAAELTSARRSGRSPSRT